MSDETNANSELLLLELGLSTDKNEFDEAKRSIEDLRYAMNAIETGFDLSGLLSGLRTAGTILKGLVNSWNALQDKTITVAYATNNYLPYNLDPGTRQNIENRLNESTVAQKFGVTPSAVLSDLSSIISKQEEVKNLGRFIADDNVNALYQLGAKLGDPRFQGDNLSALFTDASAPYVYEAITDLLSNAYREAYKLPDKSEERQEWLKLIKGVENTPFVSENVSQMLAFYTEPYNPTYSSRGNPMTRYLSASVEDDTKYMDSLRKWLGAAIELSSDVDNLKSDIKESVDTVTTGVFNTVGSFVVLPLLSNILTVTDVITGRRMRDAHGLEFDWGKGVFNNIGTSQRRIGQRMDFFTAYDQRIPARFGLTSNWTEGYEDLTARLGVVNGKITVNSLDPLKNELRMYELMRLSQSTYERDSKDLIDFALESMTKNEEFKWGRNKKYRTREESYDARVNALFNPNSQYYIGSKGGFYDVYTMLYRTGSLGRTAEENEKAYLQIMAKVFANTKRQELASFFGEDNFSATTDLTKTKIKNVNGSLRLVVTIREDGKEDREYFFTPEELASGASLTTEHTLEQSKAGY